MPETTTPTRRHYGWRPDLPDQRDHMFSAPMRVMAVLPPSVDLRAACPPVYDQGQTESCTGNSIAGAIQYERMQQKLPNADLVPSRLFIYYNERVLEHDVAQDGGGQIRDGIKAAVSKGACFETGDNAWPFDPAKVCMEPPSACYTEAANNKVLQYSRLLQNIQQLKGCLAAGCAFVFGFTVYESFESPEVAASGVLPMPAATEKTMGGHAVLAVGYDDAAQMFWIRNSWGPAWGQQGYFQMPYAYISSASLASDFWTIKLVEAS
jgi:C1A family cysteine protease